MYRIRVGVSAALTALIACAGAAQAQQLIHSEDFENCTTGNCPWTVNGVVTLVPAGGNPGQYLVLPYGDFFGVVLRFEEAGGALLGDLTRHGGPLMIALDIQVFQLNNFFGDPMDPGNFPFVLEFVDYPDPGSTEPTVSVYYTGPGLPKQGQGWVRYEYEVPDPTQTALPPGWGGTGAEDPVTYMPILPPNRTYRDVLENVDEMRLTTFVPGYLYAASFWEIGFDNVTAHVESQGCYADCDQSGGLDLFDFLCFTNAFNSGDPYADCDGSGGLDLFDFLCFTNAFNAGCP
jgi:hypothetical protein